MYLVHFALLGDSTAPLVQLNQLTKFLPFLFPGSPCAAAASHIHSQFLQHVLQTSNLLVRVVAGSMLLLRLNWLVWRNYRTRAHVDPVPRLVRLLWACCPLWVIVTSARFFYMLWPWYQLPDFTALARVPELFDVARIHE